MRLSIGQIGGASIFATCSQASDGTGNVAESVSFAGLVLVGLPPGGTSSVAVLVTSQTDPSSGAKTTICNGPRTPGAGIGNVAGAVVQSSPPAPSGVQAGAGPQIGSGGFTVSLSVTMSSKSSGPLLPIHTPK
jgi:hypothetical protein